jgi:uncharacterized protein
MATLAPDAVSQTTHWQACSDLYRLPLPDDHTVVFSPAGYSKIAVLNRPALALLDWFMTPRVMHQTAPFNPFLNPNDSTAIARLMESGLIRPAGVPLEPRASPPAILTAWLHLTSACPLNCRYCYVPQKNEFMDERTGHAAIDAVFRSAARHEFQQVSLKYAGGEATLCFSLIERLHDYALQMADQTGIKVREVLLSSGVTLRQWMIEALRDMGIRLVISLDGVGAAHDTQRVFHGGQGSSWRVMQSIDDALLHHLRPDLSITVTDASADALSPIIAFAIERGLRFNLNLYRHPPRASHPPLIMDHRRVIDGIYKALDEIEARLPQQRLIDGLLDRSSFASAHVQPCGAGSSYLVIDQQGQIAACQMEMEQQVTHVYVDDPLSRIRASEMARSNVGVDHKRICADCRWRYWCAGGCPLFTSQVEDRVDTQSPYCDIYTALYPAIVRLEGLRLLKWDTST